MQCGQGSGLGWGSSAGVGSINGGDKAPHSRQRMFRLRPCDQMVGKVDDIL